MAGLAVATITSMHDPAVLKPAKEDAQDVHPKGLIGVTVWDTQGVHPKGLIGVPVWDAEVWTALFRATDRIAAACASGRSSHVHVAACSQGRTLRWARG